jgi:hypothetical protein
MKTILKIILKVLMGIGIGLVGFIALFYIIYAFFPKGPRDLMSFQD